MSDRGTPPTIELTIGIELPEPFRHAYAYWLKLTPPGAPGPTVDDFHIDELEPRIIPWSVLVDVIAEPLDFKYRFWGTERSNLIGSEMTGLTTATIPTPHMRDANIREYTDVCERSKPLLCQTPVTTGSGRRAVFQSIRLPLFDDQGRVSRIFSAMNHDRIDDVSYEFYGTKSGFQ